MKDFRLNIIKSAHLRALRQQLEQQQYTIKAATDFVRQIEGGNLDVSYTRIDEHPIDELGVSLENMRDKLKAFSLEEKQRNWVTQGLAKFVDILKSGKNIQALADDIIRSLVKYMAANQGALYILNDEDKKDPYLEMLGCYAYDRKKHLSQRITIGQGIAGQVFLEKSTTYLKDVPKDYVKITSGLGEALPRNVLIVPLKINEVVLGVVELASFNTIKPYEIKFVETIGESIASAISSVKTMTRTQKLLEETQLQSEQMRAVEEEMRQNMEELTATQEEMIRAQKRTEAALKEVSEKEIYMQNMLNASHDGIFTVDRDFKFVLINKIVLETFQQKGINLQPGFDVIKLSAPGQEEDFLIPYKRAFAGEVVELERSYFDHHYLITYNPIRNDSGEIVGVSVFTKDISIQKSLLLDQQKHQELEKQRHQKAEQNREILKNLIKNESIQNGDIEVAMEEITKALSASFEVSRAAVWKYNESAPSISLSKMYVRDQNEFLTGVEIYKKDVPTYFQSVESEEVIVAEDTFAHPALVEFRSGYLDVYDIRSMLDIPFFLDGKIGGVICCEHQHATKEWSTEDVTFGKAVADIITVAFKSHVSKELLQQSQQLTEELKAQEEEIRQNMEELAATQEEIQRQMIHMEAMKRDLELREHVFGHTTILSEADVYGNILMVNDKLCAVSGYTREELIGKPHNIFRHADMPQELFGIFWNTIKAGKTFNAIIKNRCKDGSHYWVDATIVPIKDDQGNVYKYVGARYHIKSDEMAIYLYNKQAQKLKLPQLQENLAIAS